MFNKNYLHFSFPRKSAQRYIIFLNYATYARTLYMASFFNPPFFRIHFGEMIKKLKIFAEKFGGLKKVRTFAIPKQSGGGEMVDTLL